MVTLIERRFNLDSWERLFGYVPDGPRTIRASIYFVTIRPGSEGNVYSQIAIGLRPG